VISYSLNKLAVYLVNFLAFAHFIREIHLFQVFTRDKVSAIIKTYQALDARILEAGIIYVYQSLIHRYENSINFENPQSFLSTDTHENLYS
jgi:hypothetical protein